MNRTTGNVVDGHLRIELALGQKAPTVPVTHVELSEAEELLVLASFDLLAAMASAERDQLAVEAALGPLDILRRWLAEAHVYDNVHS